MSETSMALWKSVVDEFVRGEAAPADFVRPGMDRVALIRGALKLPGGNNRAAAVALLKKMSAEEKQSLFPELIQLARAAHGPVGAVREIILSLPREWVLERIDAQVEPILRNEEYDDYWMFLELYEKLDPLRAVKLARRAAGSADAEIRELGLERLANLVAAAAADTPAAQTLRAALGPVWQGATNHERSRGLAEDLQALAEGGTKAIEMSPEETEDWRQKAKMLYTSLHLDFDVDAALAFLRGPHPRTLPPDVIPFLQGRCWERLGDPDAALVFYREAGRLDPGHSAAVITVLLALHRYEEAVKESDILISAPNSQPEDLFLATAPLLAVVKGKPPHEAKRLYERVASTLARANTLLSRRWAGAGGDSAELRRYIVAALALTYQELGRQAEALGVINRALNENPADADLLALRGHLRYETDVKGALSDFAVAARRGTTEFEPYYVLAQHALHQGAWLVALRYAIRALEFTPPTPAVHAEVYEALAIAQAQLGQPGETVLENFKSAAGLDPSNERIRRNLGIAQSMLTTPAGRDKLRRPDAPRRFSRRPLKAGVVSSAAEADALRAEKALNEV